MVVVVPGPSGSLTPSTGAAFSDYLDLRTAVVENVQRADIADVFPRLVALAEARFNRQLRTRAQIKTGTISIASGRAALPSDMLEILSAGRVNGGEYLQQAASSLAINPHATAYAIEGDEMAATGIEGDVQVMYYARIPALVELSDTNWILQKYPDVYLYGVAFEAAKYIRDGEMAQANQQLMNEAISELRADDNRLRYSRTRVRVAGCTP